MRKKILVVEDNTDLVELLRLSLKEAGFTVTTAQNGVDALKKIRATPPDLIVLDLVLPELDGFAVCESLRQDSATASIPVLLLSGLSGEFARYTGMECGAHEFVTKPVSPDHLVSRIRHWLEQPPQPRSASPQPPPKLACSTNRVD